MKAIKTQRLRWYGHVRRMGEEKVVNKVTEWKAEFRRARGRSKRRWEEQDGGHKKANNPQLGREIQDRKSWKKNTKEVKMKKALEEERRKK